MVLLVNPVGDFPLIDDWDYGRTVYQLLKDGKLQFSGFMFPTLIAQVVWGILFCLPFGFSFTALRLSALSLALISLLATYRLLRQLKIKEHFAFMGALTIAVNPLFFLVSHTFLTDVPFLTLWILSTIFFILGLKTERRSNLWIATLFSCGAILIRQFGIVLPLSFGITYLIKKGFGKKNLLLAFTPLILTGGVLVSYMLFLKTLNLPDAASSTLSYAINLIIHQSPRLIVILKIKHTFTYILLIGLSLLPFLILWNSAHWHSISSIKRMQLLTTYLLLSSLFIGWLLWQKSLLPLPGNIFYDIGLGAVTLWGSDNPPNLPHAPKAVWVLITFAAIIGSVMLLHALFSAVKKILSSLKKRTPSEFDESPLLFAFSTSVLYFLCLCILLYAADRYIIPLLPLMMIFILSQATPIPFHINRLSTFIAAVLLLVYGTFSVAATHDYLSWNRARWKALHYLTEEAQISYNNIDGGFEFNGWYEPDPAGRKKAEKSWNWLFRKFDYTDYVLSFQPIKGFREIARYPFKRWLPLGKGYIYILVRENSRVQISKH